MSATWQAVDLDFLFLLWKAWKLTSVFTCCKLELFCESQRVSSNLQQLRICVLKEDKLTVPCRERTKTVSNLHFLQGLCGCGIHRGPSDPDPHLFWLVWMRGGWDVPAFCLFQCPRHFYKKHLGECDYPKASATSWALPCAVCLNQCPRHTSPESQSCNNGNLFLEN